MYRLNASGNGGAFTVTKEMTDIILRYIPRDLIIINIRKDMVKTT